LLLGAAGALWLLRLKGKFDIGRPDSKGYAPVEDEDLNALGILEIRPKAGKNEGRSGDGDVGTKPARAEKHRSPAAPPQRSMFESEERVSSVEMKVREPIPVERNGSSVEYGTSRTPTSVSGPVTMERKSPQYQVASCSDRIDGGVVLPCLESLCAALEANTVCLLGSEAEGKGHRIHAIVSRNAYARSGGELTPGNGMRWSVSRHVTVERAADATWDPYDLQYYRETIAVKELAYAAVPTPPGSMRFLLIADSMNEGVLENSKASRVFEHFAGLLGEIVGSDAEVPTDRAPAFRPRREIIAEEMQRARKRDSPLAFALVMLNRAEEVVASEGPEVVAELESGMRARLDKSADKLRVDRFGDLMFGVFVSLPLTDVELWAMEVYDDFEKIGEDYGGGVSIGVAMLADRHKTHEQLKADAAAALQEAVQSGVCTILE
ncbi:MAG: hypothetical protein HKN13_00590, partial [Rhodothermales bacterium]|nr:hypothetical protein [Rhodothermales bacterium]